MRGRPLMGRRLGLRGRSIASGAPLTLSALLDSAGSDLMHWWDFTDTSTMFQETAGTTPIADGQTLKRVNDKGTNADNLTEATNAPVWSAQASGVPAFAAFDTTKILTAAIGGGAGYSDVSVFMVVRKDDADTTGAVIASAAAGSHSGTYQGGVTIHPPFQTAIGGTMYGNGATIASRDALHDLLELENFDVLEHAGPDMSGWTNLIVNGFQAAFQADVDVSQIIMINSGAWLTANRNKIQGLLS